MSISRKLRLAGFIAVKVVSVASVATVVTGVATITVCEAVYRYYADVRRLKKQKLLPMDYGKWWTSSDWGKT